MRRYAATISACAQLTSAAEARGFRANLWLSDFFLFPFELRGDADPIPVEWPSSIDKERVVKMFNIELTTKGIDRLRPSKGPPPSQKVEQKKGYSNPLCAVSMFPFPDAISDQLNAAASERRFLSDFWMLEYHVHLLRFKSSRTQYLTLWSGPGLYRVRIPFLSSRGSRS